MVDKDENTNESGTEDMISQRDLSEKSITVFRMVQLLTRGPSEAIMVLISTLVEVDVQGRENDIPHTSTEELLNRLPREKMIADMQAEVKRIYEFLLPDKTEEKAPG